MPVSQASYLHHCPACAGNSSRGLRAWSRSTTSDSSRRCTLSQCHRAHVVSNTWRKSPHASRYTVSRHTRLTLHRVPHAPQAIDCSQLEDGEVVVQCEMLSVDAFLRTMLDEEAYHGAIKLGDTLPALGYGRVIASANPKFKIGKRVSGMLGARSVARLKAEQSAGLFPFLSLPRVKPTTMMGLLGITSGLTAHVGIHSVTKPPRRGQTVLVSGASGAAGSVAAQLAKLTGAKVVGVAGGVRKAAYLLDELKLDGAVDYKDGATTLGAQLDRLVRRVPRSSTVPSASHHVSLYPLGAVPGRHRLLL